MTFTKKTILTFSLVLLPTSVLAAPTNITQVEATLENGVLHVSWEPANDDAGIDFYRVYFSHESILDHEGNYDDSVKTDGDGTTYEFGERPLQSEKIFVAILAVNKDGIESEGFEAEASVDNPPQEIPPAPEEQGPPEDAVDLALKAMRRSDGTYNVVATWGRSEDSKRTLNAYVLYVSKDGDQFDRSSLVSMNQTSVRYAQIPAGVFGVKVTAKDAIGNESGGIREVITLPESGIGLLGITVFSGLMAARRTRRRKSC